MSTNDDWLTEVAAKILRLVSTEAGMKVFRGRLDEWLSKIQSVDDRITQLKRERTNWVKREGLCSEAIGHFPPCPRTPDWELAHARFTARLKAPVSVEAAARAAEEKGEDIYQETVRQWLHAKALQSPEIFRTGHAEEGGREWRVSLFAWVPPKLSTKNFPDKNLPLPLPAGRRLSLHEQYGVLATIHDTFLSGVDYIWQLPDNLSEDLTFFSILRWRLSLLKPSDHVVIKGYLDEVEEDIAKGTKSVFDQRYEFDCRWRKNHPSFSPHKRSDREEFLAAYNEEYPDDIQDKMKAFNNARQKRKA